jgi:hypothetical protein
MMEKTHDWTDAEIAKARQPLVRPCPVALAICARRGSLPQHRVAHRADAQPGEELEIGAARCMTRPFQLIVVDITHAIDSALDPSP